MSEDNTKNLDADSTNPLPFEEFVRQHLALLIKQGNELREQQVKLQEEMVERFLQLSRQIKDLDQKVNVFIREQTYIKDDVRELREERLPKV
jgi:hypothetical protein